jgi:peroxiredoxin
MTIEIGDTAPDFTLKNQHGESVTLSELVSEGPVVVVFFPFAFTGICTGEMCEIRDNLGDLEDVGAQVVAVSCDSTATLRTFADTENLNFPLLSDFWPHGATAQAYDVFNDVTGSALRGTFVVDTQRVVRWKIENGMPDARNLEDYRVALSGIA